MAVLGIFKCTDAVCIYINFLCMVFQTISTLVANRIKIEFIRTNKPEDLTLQFIAVLSDLINFFKVQRLLNCADFNCKLQSVTDLTTWVRNQLESTFSR